MGASLANTAAKEELNPPGRTAFAQRFSIEATRPGPAEIATLASTLAPGTQVYLSAVPSLDSAELVGAAICAIGSRPAFAKPFAARRLASAGQLNELLR